MSRFLVFVLSFLFACGDRSPVLGVAQAADTLPPIVGCANPVDFGAVADDRLSDRVAFQSALDAITNGGTLCIPSGRWTLERAPVGSYNRFAALATHGHDVVIRGEGPSTILEVFGDQGAGSSNVIGIDPGAERVTVRDLQIDTSGMTNTDEQSHAIAIGSAVCATCLPLRDIRVLRVAFKHTPALAPARKGDCVRLLGNGYGSRIEGVTISDSTFANCARSGVAVQRNVYGLQLLNNRFSNAQDQDVDFEPTGGVGDLNARNIISGNIFNDDDQAATQGDYAVAVGGGGGGPNTQTVIEGNVFIGRGLRLYRNDTIVISANVFVVDMRNGAGVINSANVLRNATISGNTITRRGVAGPMIRATAQSGGFPDGVLITGNTLRNETASGGVYFESADRVQITGNRFQWTVSAAGQTAIYNRATSKPTVGLHVSSNTIDAPLGIAYGVLTSASPYAASGVFVIGNQFTGVGATLTCAGSAALGPVVFAANGAAATGTCLATVTP